ASSLGQMAHFVLVRHAICLEHGELIEASEHSHSTLERAEPSSDRSEAQLIGRDVETDHDHCQFLSSARRERALVPDPHPLILPALRSGMKPVVVEGSTCVVASVPLAVAPKTSPPLRALLG